MITLPAVEKEELRSGRRKFMNVRIPLVLLTLTTVSLPAQRSLLLPPENQPIIDFEPVNLVAEDPSKSRLDIIFRVSHDFFIFVRNETGGSSSAFIAQGEITVEIFDRTNASAARQIIRRQIGADQPLPALMRNEFLQGVFSFALQPGEYGIYFEINDLQSDRKFVNREKKVTLGDFGGNRLESSVPLFVDPASRGEGNRRQRFIPLNFGGDAVFGRDFGTVIQFTGDPLSGGPFKVYYRLMREARSKQTLVVHDSVQSENISEGLTLAVEDSGSSPYYKVVPSSLNGLRLAFFKVDGARLNQGSYTLQVDARDGTDNKTIRRSFTVRWFDKPLSLRDIDFAIEAMRPLVGDDVNKWRSLSDNEKDKVFDEYWKAKDETPETALNERQEEYFRRADYAYYQFSSLKQRNGILTDRGKVFVLYGPSSKAERNLLPDKPPRETWYYEAIGKMFIFEDSARNGEYVLIKSESL